MIMTGFYAVLHIGNWNPVLFQLGNGVTLYLSVLIGALNTILAFALFICAGMIYASIKFLQEWANPLTVINYTLLGSASGFVLATTLATFVDSELVGFYASWAIILTVSALITRLASLIRNANIKYKSNLSTAIGIRHPSIQQQSRGFMGGSFNTRDYFHGAKPFVFKSIKWFFLIMVFFIPIALLFTGLGMPLFLYIRCSIS